MFRYKISKNLDKILLKLSKKDKKLYGQILKKIYEISNSSDADHYKNLKHDLKEFKRAHIGQFVLVFRLNKKENLVYFTDFDHHDKIYLKRF
jgi:YafQ family addiction module toxin component